MPVELTAARAGHLRAELGETPRLDARTGELLWTDITGGKVHFGAVSGKTVTTLRSFDVGALAGPVTPLSDVGAGWIMASGEEIVHLDMGGKTSLIASPELNRGTAFNDGVADPHGNLWVGSMGTGGVLGAGRLWRLDTKGRATVALTGIGISNGLDFTPDGRTAFYVDTTIRVLRRLDIDSHGAITAQNDVVVFPPGVGDPDGLVLDDEGCIWIALWDGWAVHRYSPLGELLAVVTVPVARPTAVAFAKEMLIITSCSGWLEEGWEQRQPDAGRLFSVRAGVSGPPARPFCGSLETAHLLTDFGATDR